MARRGEDTNPTHMFAIINDKQRNLFSPIKCQTMAMFCHNY